MHLAQASLGATSLLTVMATAAAADVAGPASASASQSAGLEESASQPAGLEEIKVTARRRQESEQTVPLSITAMGADQLANQHIDSFVDMASKVPGFVAKPYNVTQSNLWMRGIGTDIPTSASNPAVAIFIDDVYLSQNGALWGDLLWDLERVEVLEGPQSTLFGKNAVGGLVNFVTRKPSQTPYASAELTLGNYGEVDARAVAGGPLSSTLAASISLSSQAHNGYETNTLDGNTFDQLSGLETVRGHLRFTPSDDLDVLLSADATRRRGTGRYIDITYTTRNQMFVNPSREGEVSGPVCSQVTGEKFANNFGGGPLNGPLDCESPEGVANVDDYGTSLRIDWKTGLGKLTSLTAYRDDDILAEENSAGTYMDFAGITPFVTPNDSIPDDFYYQRWANSARQFSQELRMTSDSTGPLSWIGGLYFLHELIDDTAIQNFLFPDIFWYGGTQIEVGNTRGNSYGAFAEGTYRWDSGFGVTVGGRYSRDEKDWYYSHTGYSTTGSYGKDVNGVQIPTPQGFNASTSDSWSAFTPNFVLDWKSAPGQYYYFKIARGYQSGGFGATTAGNPQEAEVPFKPEYALNYEAGAKLDLLDRRLRINPTVYWTDYTDLQILTLVPGFVAADIISNAGKARSRGAELQIDAAPVHGFELYGNYAYLDCTITASTLTPSIYGAVIDINGKQCRRAPKNSFNVGSRVESGAGTIGTLFAEVDYSWTDRFFSDNDNNSTSAVGAEYHLDGSLGLKSRDGRWEVSVWGKNLTNQLLVSGRVALVTPDCRTFVCDHQSLTVFSGYLPPRTYGVTFRWNNAPP
jgi:iron complex outermembrane recepter protein